MAKFTLDNFKEKAGDLAQSSVAFSYQTAEMAKLRLAILSEEDTIKKAYLEMGKRYFQEHKEDPDAAYIPACQRIVQAQAAIETHEKRVQELRNPDILWDIPDDAVETPAETAEESEEVTASDAEFEAE